MKRHSERTKPDKAELACSAEWPAWDLLRPLLESQFIPPAKVKLSEWVTDGREKSESK